MLSHDPAVDLGILSNPPSVASASIASGSRIMQLSGTEVGMAIIWIPFLNVDNFSVGMACGRAETCGLQGKAPPELDLNLLNSDERPSFANLAVSFFFFFFF